MPKLEKALRRESKAGKSTLRFREHKDGRCRATVRFDGKVRRVVVE
jgi:hypothetical protein